MRVITAGCSLVIAGLVVAAVIAGPASPVPAQSAAADDARLDELKREVVVDVEARRDLTQQIVDSIFSFGELGFQEFETQRYLGGILEQHGFAVERGVAGMPSAWVAKWGSGRPVIALGTDVDGIPQASQKPGVAYRDPLVPGAPGHGEGHNTGQGLMVTAAIAVKQIMEREKLPGTIVVWPGIAEEQLGSKAHFVRAGVFADVDVVIFSHVGAGLSTGWGDGGGSGLVSIEYLFEGEAAHGASSPWEGRSALDGVELMNVAWNFRREHLPIRQRSHYVISNGGDQPNVVPPTASVWYYFREIDYAGIKRMWDIGDRIAEGAAMMTDTTVTSRVLGSAWPRHTNRALAEAMHANIQATGMPQWSEQDHALAKAVQALFGDEPRGLSTEIGRELRGREQIPEEDKTGGTSDDIGDISWVVPTVVLSYPSNIPGGGPGHNWNRAIASATPIAHKGATAGAKVVAMTMVDLLLKPELVQAAKDYFTNVQGTYGKYVSLLRPQDKPAIWLNENIMAQYKPELQKYYYDPSKYKTYLDQLGIAYPTVKN